jgi:hypothetical protein
MSNLTAARGKAGDGTFFASSRIFSTRLGTVFAFTADARGSHGPPTPIKTGLLWVWAPNFKAISSTPNALLATSRGQRRPPVLH